VLASQVALAVSLAVCASAVARGFIAARAIPAGFDRERLLTVRLHLDRVSYPQPEDIVSFTSRLTSLLEAHPGIEAAAVTTALPMSEAVVNFDRPVFAEGHPPASAGHLLEADLRVVGDGYFQTLGTPVEGREFDTHDDGDGTPAVVINHTLAARLWPGESALGKRLMVDFTGGWQPYTVVGIADDMRFYGLDLPIHPEMFFPQRQMPFYREIDLAVRVRGEPDAAAPIVRSVIQQIDPTQAVQRIAPMSALVAQTLARERLAAQWLVAMGTIALALAGLGIHAVLSIAVARRRPELGLRMALGASRGQIMRSVVGETAAVATTGLLIGAVVAGAARNILRPFVTTTGVMDSLVLASVALVLLTTIGLAVVWPTRRALAIDPATVLRHDRMC
jgi:predicted permease